MQLKLSAMTYQMRQEQARIVAAVANPIILVCKMAQSASSLQMFTRLALALQYPWQLSKIR